MQRIAAALLLLLTCAVTADPAKWREDLAYLKAELPRVHKNAFHTMTREDFDRAIAELDARLDELQDHEVAVELSRIVTRVNDGHTHIAFHQPVLGFRMLPVTFHRLSDGIFTGDGAKVLRIGDVSAEEAWKRVEEVTPRDNEMSLRARTALHLMIPEILHALRISPSKDRVTLQTDKGAVELQAGPMTPPPALKNFDYEYLANEKALVVRRTRSVARGRAALPAAVADRARGAARCSRGVSHVQSEPMYANLGTESEMNQLGYALLREKRVDDALAVLRLNAESYPKSANVHDSLAEALLAKGSREEAIKAYEKALELEPWNPYRRDVLEATRGASGSR